MEQDNSNRSPPKKSNKPQMERKRRERINNSLDELKSLVLGAMKKDASYYSKLEKADILEMAVDHVRNLQKQIRSGQTNEADPMAKYRAGFVACKSKVEKLVVGFPDLDENVKFNVLNHLANCFTGDERRVASTETPPTKTDVKSDQLRNSHVRDTTTMPLGTYNNSNTHSPLTSLSQILDTRTMIEEKKMAYQQICSRQSVKRAGCFSPTNEINMRQNHNNVTSIIHSSPAAEELESRQQQQQQMKTDVKSISTRHKSDIGWITTSNNFSNDNNNSNVMRQISLSEQQQGLIKLPAKTCSNTSSSNNIIIRPPDGNVIKPVPQVPEKIFISNGIRFMPATVLVPVQFGYSTLDYNSNKQPKLADEKSAEVWRPWEKMGQFAAKDCCSHHVVVNGQNNLVS
eukprot:gene16950-18657_t